MTQPLSNPANSKPTAQPAPQKSFHVFKSRIPQCTFYDSKGGQVLFVHGRFETEDLRLAEELRLVCQAGNPLIYQDSTELTVQRLANPKPVSASVALAQVSQAQPNQSLKDTSPTPAPVQIQEIGGTGNEVLGVGTMMIEQEGKPTEPDALAKAIAAAGAAKK